MSAKRMLVVGIDGATFDLVRPFMEAGDMPTLKALVARGVSGDLESTIPPITGPAWASFMTGSNPGRHSVGDFMRRRPNQYTLQPVNSRSVHAVTLWELMGDAGKNVIVMNVPVTYPASPVNGIMVTGLLTPSSSEDFSYPRNISGELLKKFDYQVHLREAYSKAGVERYLADLRQMEAKRLQAAEHLMNKIDWDFCMVHFVATDAMQHTLWHLIDESHPLHDPQEASRYGGAIRDMYRQVDQALARLIELAGEDTTVVVLSDHGFGPLKKYIYLNNWLLEEGFLKLKGDLLTRLKTVLFRLGFTPEFLYRTIQRIGLAKFAFRAGKGTRYGLMKLLFLSAANIDWSKTVAYSYGNIGQIYLNVEGREPEGIVSREDYPAVRARIAERLKTLSDPETGEAVIGQIFMREDIYSGPYLEEMADIIMLPDDLSYQAAGLSEFMSNAVMRQSFAYSGGHRMNGIFAAAGEEIKSGGTVEGARLIDVGPTILYLMGLPVPDHMDGQILSQAIQDAALAARPPRFFNLESDGGFDGDSGLSEQEEEEVVRRLRDLGYVS
jgi:predicted AlkP superfamily phosphohydrolase/phosphomutase